MQCPEHPNTHFVLLIVTSKAMLLVNPSPFGLYCVVRTELDAFLMFVCGFPEFTQLQMNAL